MTADPTATELLQSAQNFFLKYGYTRVSTDEIASSSGRSKKTLYKHFGAKDQLLLAVLEQLNQQAEQTLATLKSDGSQPGIERLQTMLDAISTNIISSQATLFRDLKDREPDLYQRARQERDQALADLLTPELQGLAAQGELRSDLAFHHAIDVFITIIDAIGNPMDLASHDPSQRRRLDMTIRLFIDGLRYRDGGP